MNWTAIMIQSVTPDDLALRPIGWVESTLTAAASAPRQPDEGAPEAWLVFDRAVEAGLANVVAGSQMVLVTWLDKARRDVLRVRPRDDAARPERGVFATRSSDRPNPIGLHDVEVVAVAGLRIKVAHLEVFNGTPILDLKPALPKLAER